jgi:glucose/mannose-6-phosphate isomerase
MHTAIFTFPEQLDDALSIGKNIKLMSDYSHIENIVFMGMGGSAIGGNVVSTLIQNEIQIPFTVIRGYEIPKWSGPTTLVICSSYSGNTEETLSSYELAIKQGCTICGITSGGKLLELLKANDQDAIVIPGDYQPRSAIGFSFVPVLYFLNLIGLISDRLFEDISAASDVLKNARHQYSEANKYNPCFNLAKQIYRSLPVIIGTENFSEVIARRWKGQITENAKMLAYHNELPEMNHNEIEGWESNPEIINNCVIIWLIDKSDNERNIIRQKVTKELLSTYQIPQEEIEMDGANPVIRLMQFIHFGDWLSYWCAQLHGIKPTPVKKIEKLKAVLGSYSDSKPV